MVSTVSDALLYHKIGFLSRGEYNVDILAPMPISRLTKRPNRDYGRVDSTEPSLATSRTYAIGNSSGRSKRPRRPGGGNRLKQAILLILGLGAAGIVFGSIAFVWINHNLPDPSKLNDQEVAQSTKIYDRTGTHLLFEVFHDQKRTLVELNKISPWVSKATIAIEDKYFYQHNGIRLISILRAGFNNLIGRKTGSGGASTLTQQLVKNVLVGDEHSLMRKVKEALLALKLERSYTKDQILQLYLNQISYGSTNYGIESASENYFHKTAADLTLAEAATLAALPKAPSHYLNNLQDLRDRRDAVLRLMFEQGYIKEDEKNTAQNQALRLYRDAGLREAPHFVLYVRQQLDDKFGERLVDTGGLKVITTLDYDKQVAAEKIVKEQGDKFAKDANANNASLVAIDPHTAQIVTLVGSRDFNNEDIDGQFNVAILGKRQPGSSFKPFVYTAAFEKGYTPATVLYDVTTDFDLRTGNEKYIPKNYDNKEHGLVTMRKALAGSLNIPAVKTLYLVGMNNAIDFAKRFGYTTFTGDYGLSLVLGGGEVNLLEHTNAYATLADNGVYRPPVSILKVEDDKGGTLYEWKQSDGTEAVKPELAALTTSVLTDDNARAFTFGLHSTLTLPDRAVAAKTGTTNNNKDAWTLGYVPSLAAGVWVGNTTPAPMKGGGNKLAGAIWNQFMRAALKGAPVEQFPAPPPNDAVKPVLRGTDGGIVLPINKTTGKVATSSTPESLVEMHTYLPPHDILHYVNRDDPRGPIPDNPDEDGQYQNWETAVQEWADRERAKGNEITFADPPTDYDTQSSPELAPSVEFISPTANQSLTSREVTLKVKAAAPRGVYQVAYSLDDNPIGTNTQYPFSLTYNFKNAAKGPHTFKAVASDDQGNTAMAVVTVNLTAELDPPSIDWTDKNPLTIHNEDFPRVMYLNPFRWDDIKEVQIFLKSNSQEKWIYTFNHTEDKLFNNQLSFTWKHNPGAGKYTLRAALTDTAGKQTDKNLSVEIVP